MSAVRPLVVRGGLVEVRGLLAGTTRLGSRTSDRRGAWRIDASKYGFRVMMVEPILVVEGQTTPVRIERAESDDR